MCGSRRSIATGRRRFPQPVVSGLLRGDWKYDGILVTDDFSMGAAYRSDGGLAARQRLGAQRGVDLILVSYDPDQFFPVVHALLRAQAQGGCGQDAAGAAAIAGSRRMGGLKAAVRPLGRSVLRAEILAHSGI